MVNPLAIARPAAPDWASPLRAASFRLTAVTSQRPNAPRATTRSRRSSRSPNQQGAPPDSHPEDQAKLSRHDHQRGERRSQPGDAAAEHDGDARNGAEPV